MEALDNSPAQDLADKLLRHPHRRTERDMGIRPPRCEATLRFDQRVIRCVRQVHGEGEHEADIYAHCNEPGEPGLSREREADLTLVWGPR